MLNVNEKEAAALLALQRGIDFVPRPFAALAAKAGLTEAEVVALANRLLADGSARRFGAIFDARRLGYRSMLCAVRAPDGARLETLAAIAGAEPGVTHVYERGWPKELDRYSPGGPEERTWPNLWFTLVAPADRFDEILAGLRAQMAPDAVEAFGAVKRFKIDVVFDLRTRDRDEGVEPELPPDRYSPDAVVPDRLQQELVRIFQGNVPVCEDFFAGPARELGLTEEALIARLAQWHEAGVIRRLGLLLQHRKVGFMANGMCCWPVAPWQALDAGRRVAAFPEVTHCYERPASAAFPFTLYGMIHCDSWRVAQETFTRISASAGLPPGQLLLSLREFKKTSMVFF